MSSSSSSAAPVRGVKLRKSTAEMPVNREFAGWRFTVTAHDAYDMPNEIFMYLRRPIYTEATTNEDEFQCVCSVADLSEYPAITPSGTPPFFRSNVIDMVFRSAREAEAAWDELYRQVQALVDALNASDRLTTVEEFHVS